MAVQLRRSGLTGAPFSKSSGAMGSGGLHINTLEANTTAQTSVTP